MAPIGGGPPVGSTNTFTGTAQAIELIGDHFYSYSGPVEDAGSGSAATLTNKFTTGNYYCVGNINWATNSQGADTIYFEVSMNNSQVIQLQWDGSPALESNPPFELIIPPYTEVEVKWGMASGTTKNMCILITGRIYR